MKPGSIFKNYSSIIWLLGGIILGSIAGIIFGEKVAVIKPLGDIFLNLLFTAVIPLVFFAIASAIAGIDQSKKLGRVMIVMLFVFLGTVLLSAFLTIVAVWIFPIHQDFVIAKTAAEEIEKGNFGQQLTQLVTTNEFFELLSRKNMLALIIFSFLTGFAILRAGKSGENFKNFIDSGNEVMKNLLMLVMKIAPLGLGAYFAYQAGVFGPQLFGTYAKSLAIYYGFGTFYFIVFFSLYAFAAGGFEGIKVYWKNNIVPSITALGTCSSIATIPVNLQASNNMGVPRHISNVVVPLGASLHKDGSSISSIIKIAVLFAMFGKDFTGINTVLIALGITVIVSIVEGGIPNGGYIGELLVIAVYGFPPEALPAVMIIGTLVDPLATLLNVSGDTVSGMMIARVTEGKNWIRGS